LRYLLCLAACIWLLVPGSARAVITVTFYAHNYNYLSPHGTPHAFIWFSGTLNDGSHPISINEGWGFAPNDDKIHLSFQPGMVGPEPGELSGSTAYLRTTIPDAKYRELVSRFPEWQGPGDTYNLALQNCVHFTAWVAREVGLQTPLLVVPEPTTFMRSLISLNPGKAAVGNLPPGSMTPDQLRDALNNWDEISTQRAAYAADQSTYMTAASDKFRPLERERQTLVQTQRDESQRVRSENMTRMSAQNRARSADQARLNARDYAQVQAQIRNFEDRIRQATSITIPLGAGNGGASNPSQSGDGAATIVAPLPDPCQFFQCNRPGPSHSPDQRKLLQPRSATSAPPAAQPLVQEFRASVGGTAAPDAARNILHLGNLLPGQSVDVDLTLDHLLGEDTFVAYFSEGGLRLRPQPPGDLPRNVHHFRGSGSAIISLTFTAPTLAEIAQPDALPVARLVVTHHGIIKQEIFISYDLYPQEQVDFTFNTGSVSTGSGERWSPNYELCSGPRIFGYSLLEIVSHEVRSDRSDHPRECGSWTNCSLYQDPGAGTCFVFSAQGHDKRNRPFSDDVGRYGFTVQGSLTARFRLDRPPPTWLSERDFRQ
jgi:hypothetical protein